MQYDLPFEFMGFTSFSSSLAQLSACVFGVFASLVTPFGGFLASGMKRAYKIKDFSQALPGHGGFVDRFDCITCLTVFAYHFLTQIYYKDYFKLEDSYAMSAD